MNFILAFMLMASASPIDGSYQSVCKPLPKRHSIVTNIDIQDQHAYATVQLFSDATCQKLSLIVNYISQFALGPNASIDFKPLFVTMTIQDPDVVDYYNRNNGCESSSWKINDPKNISGKHCFNFDMPTIGKTGYDIYSLKGSDLQFGVFPQGASPSTEKDRPTGLSSSLYSQK